MEHMNAALESIAELARTLKQERDIARLERDEAIADYQRVYKERDQSRADATALAERLTALELSTTSELARLERERDEAREHYHQVCSQTLIEVNKAHEERDEARNAIVGWENKWKCAIEMAAKAEVERDEAREEVDRWKNKWKCAINDIVSLSAQKSD